MPACSINTLLDSGVWSLVDALNVEGREGAVRVQETISLFAG